MPMNHLKFNVLQVVSVVHVYATENTLSNMAYKDLVPCGTQRSYVRMGMSFLYRDTTYMYMQVILLMLIQQTSGFDLYAVFDPLIAKSQAILLGNKLIRWISVSDIKQRCGL